MNVSGCKKLTIPYKIPGSNDTLAYSYVVAKNWKWDYLVAINYIMVLYTQTDSDMVSTLTKIVIISNIKDVENLHK